MICPYCNLPYLMCDCPETDKMFEDFKALVGFYENPIYNNFFNNFLYLYWCRQEALTAKYIIENSLNLSEFRNN